MHSLWFEQAFLPGVWAKNVRVDISGDRIEAILSDVGAPAGAERHAIAIPGLANVHSHAFQRAIAGLTETRGSGADSFWTWRAMMYRFVDRMTPEDVETVAAYLYTNMLEVGFTRVGEFHYLHHGPDGTPYDDIGELSARIAVGAEQSDITITLLPVFYAHGDFGPEPPSEGQRRFLNNVESYARIMERARAVTVPLPNGRVGIAPHNLRAATVEEIR